MVQGDPISTREIKIGEGQVITEIDTEANAASGTPSFTNIEPAGVTTDTVTKWLKIVIAGDGTYFIPMWT